jgi:hypothetical protein
LIVSNFKGIAFRKAPNEGRKGFTPASSTELTRIRMEGEGLLLLPKTESPDPVPPYVVAQQVSNLKCDAITKITNRMRQKLLRMRASVKISQDRLSELSHFTASSNLLLLQAGPNEPDSLHLCIYNPSLHLKRKHRDEFLLPAKDFEEKLEAKTRQRQVYIDVVVNFGGVRRIVLSAKELTRPLMSDTEVKSMLVNLTELKMYQKLKTVGWASNGRYSASDKTKTCSVSSVCRISSAFGSYALNKSWGSMKP